MVDVGDGVNKLTHRIETTVIETTVISSHKLHYAHHITSRHLTAPARLLGHNVTPEKKTQAGKRIAATRSRE